MKLLWLASWYPSRLDLFNGDFIRRHAEAVSRYHDIEVIHIIKDSKGSITKNNKTEQVRTGRLTERIVYYHSPFFRLPLVGRLFSEITYRQLYKKEIKRYLKNCGKPDLVHVHVSMKAGMAALWAKSKYRMPYVVTEHSSVFLEEAGHSVNQLPFYIRSGLRSVLKQASAVSVVSDYLGKSMKPFLQGKEYAVIPNVVNTDIFYPSAKERSKAVRFIHVSGLNDAKNPEGLLEALVQVKAKRQNFTVDIFGPPNEGIIKHVADLGLQDLINFYTEIPQKELSFFLQKADALILYSRYETFGCVVIEANACGVPVIVSDIPAMREIVINGVNGLLVKKADSGALAGALVAFIDVQYQFDVTKMVALCAEKYSYGAVAGAFSKWYGGVRQGEGNSTPA